MGMRPLSKFQGNHQHDYIFLSKFDSLYHIVKYIDIGKDIRAMTETVMLDGIAAFYWRVSII